MGLRACWRQYLLTALLVIREGSYVMEEVLRELTETELESVAGGSTFNTFFNNFDSNQGAQVGVIGAINVNIDSNQGNQSVNFA